MINRKQEGRHRRRPECPRAYRFQMWAEDMIASVASGILFGTMSGFSIALVALVGAGALWLLIVVVRMVMT
jgi:hypothetical protein